jgi:hypothetical protein
MSLVLEGALLIATDRCGLEEQSSAIYVQFVFKYTLSGKTVSNAAASDFYDVFPITRRFFVMSFQSRDDFS